jgi:hypothetical protein
VNEEFCSVCDGPFHETTGHRVSTTMRWCGPCTKRWVKELVGHTNRRWGKQRFYDHARVPPPAKEYFFTFVGKKDSQEIVVTERGVSEDEAYHKSRHLLPDRESISVVLVEDTCDCDP